MNFQEMLDNITPDIYQNLKRAVELGKWPNGEKISAEQRQTCMQAVIAYELKNLPEHERTAYIPPKPHQHCGGSGEVADAEDPNEEKPLNWKS